MISGSRKGIRFLINLEGLLMDWKWACEEMGISMTARLGPQQLQRQNCYFLGWMGKVSRFVGDAFRTPQWRC